MKELAHLNFRFAKAPLESLQYSDKRIMSRTKKPAILVALGLGALVVLPLMIWLVGQLGSERSGLPTGAPDLGSSTQIPAVDYELDQLAKKVGTLIEEDLAEVLRRGDLSLNFLADLKREASRAQNDLQSGRLDRARKRFESVLAVGEAQLTAVAAMDKARSLRESTFTELGRLEYLRPTFENTYREAMNSYNTALSLMDAGEFVQSVDKFERATAILGDLEARSIEQVATLLEAAERKIESYDFSLARQAYEAVLEIDASNSKAADGLTMVGSLAEIAEEIKAVEALEAEGDLDGALRAMRTLAESLPNNPFIENQIISLESRILEQEFARLLERSVEAESAGEYALAIAELEAALRLKEDPEQVKRLVNLEETYKAARLEQLLADGFEALKGGRYESARNLYKEAVALAPDSDEARSGLEKASSLYLAGIRYSQNLIGVERSVEEGRFPLAAKLFNEALKSRPPSLTSAQKRREAAIKEGLDEQAAEVAVTIKSDGRTYVSIIGVLAPDRFKETELKLFPDVYKVRGTRKGYRDLDLELKVDASKGKQSLFVACKERI